MTSLFLILISVVILTCVWLNNISLRIGVPTLLVFILLGILFGNNGLIPLHFDNYRFAMDTCTVALIFIMFYGGFGTRWRSARPVVREAGLLATAGVLVTAALTGVFCHLALHWDLPESLLLGAVVGSTDAASVFSILRSKKLGLKNNTAPMLEVESGSNDPCAYMMTAVMLSVLKGSATAGSIAWMLFAQLAFGILGGLVIAQLAAWALEHIRFRTDGFDSLFLFAVAISSYALPSLVGGNGYLSAYLVGIILGNREFHGKKALVSFFDGLTSLMQVLIFFLLGLLARPAMLHKAILPALAIFLFMLFVARPVSVGGILLPFRKYGLKQCALVSFAGLRGAASIVFAIMATTDEAFLQHDFFNIVFCIVLLSISIQGSQLPWVSRKLDMIDEKNNVLRTFNDYSDGTEMHFSEIEITDRSAWNGKRIDELGIPQNFLIVMILRGKKKLYPRADTVLCQGDRIIAMTKGFEGSFKLLYEKTVKVNSRRVGQRLADNPGKSLIVMVRRGDENIIPNGDTILEAGDQLVILDRDAI